jgi:Skp family chaperone for outer membrane proteins
MMRRNVWAAVAVAAVGAAFVTGAAVPTPPAGPKADDPKQLVVIGQKTGYFNIARVMRESKRAKTAVARLNARRDRMAANITGMRHMHAALQAAIAKEANPKKRDALAEDLLTVARQIEDADREINKILNGRASIIIAELYDEIRAAVVGIAREHNLTAVLAYPDAVTPEEAENPYVKELKLKPPAAQPFYVDPVADVTSELLRQLNDKFDAENE